MIGLQFSANNLYLSLMPSPPIGREPSHFTAFVCGGAAGPLLFALAFVLVIMLAVGVTAKLITMPMDTAKKHLQVAAVCFLVFWIVTLA